MKTAIYHSPFGDMELSYEEGGVISLRMAEEGTKGGGALRAGADSVPGVG